MSDFDAFGRKKDEDTMSDLGWGATGEAPPSVERPSSPDVTTSTSTTPSPSADWSPAVPTASTMSSSGRRRSGGGPRLWLWGIEALVLLAIGGGIYLVVDGTKDTVNSVRDTFKTFTTPNGQTVTTQQGTGSEESDVPPTQVKSRKLFTPDGLKDALKVMERETPGKIQNLAIYPDRISYQVQRGAKYTIAQFAANAEVPSVSTTQERQPIGTGIPYDKVDVSAPARIIKGAGARLNKAKSETDYVVLQDAAGIRWIVYFKGGRYAIGDSRGRVTQTY